MTKVLVETTDKNSYKTQKNVNMLALGKGMNEEYLSFNYL